MLVLLTAAGTALQGPAAQRHAPLHRHARSSDILLLAKKKKAAVNTKGFGSKGGFGSQKPEPLPPPVRDVVRRAKTLARLVEEGADEALDAQRWYQVAAAAAELEEYAEARVIMEAGLAHCGEARGELLKQAAGQMRRVGPSAAVSETGATIEWPGKGDESKYRPETMSFTRLSAPEWPRDCPRGTHYPTGEGAIAVSVTPALPPEECAWVVEQAERTAKERWLSDHADSATIGTDRIWAKGFPDRLWLREVPGLVEWFEHRLRTRLFPMLQTLYPEAIPTADVLRCHDAFISRYDADGMADLEVHQDMTDFTFTIALNPSDDYEGGGTIFPDVKPTDSPQEPWQTVVASPDVGCVASFCGRLRHGGNAITSGVRYIIPLFIYLDRNKLTDRPRGYLLKEAGLTPAKPEGLDAFSELLSSR